MAEDVLTIFVWTFVAFFIGYYIAHKQEEWKAMQKQKIKQINAGKELNVREVWEKKK